MTILELKKKCEKLIEDENAGDYNVTILHREGEREYTICATSSPRYHVLSIHKFFDNFVYKEITELHDALNH
jgi:hypothetical protein